MVKYSVSRALRQAKWHEKNGNIVAARELYHYVLSVSPDNKMAKQALLGTRLSRYEKDLPFSSISQFLAILDQGQIIQFLGTLDQRQLDLVCEQAKRLTHDNPDSSLLWNVYGLANRELGRFDEAVVGFENACKLNSNFADAHNNLGAALSILGEVERAAAFLKRAIEIRPDHAKAHFNLGLIYFRQGKFNECEHALGRALQIRPDYVEAHHALGAVFQELGNLDDSITNFSRALELNPNIAEAHYSLGVMYEQQRKLDKAFACYTRALELNPDSAEAQNNLGDLLRKRGKLDHAVECFKRALELKPNFADAFYNLGHTLKTQGKLNEAVACYTSALQFEPNHVSASFRGAKLPTGFLPGDLLAKIERNAKRENPNDSWAQFFLANVLRHKGKIEESFNMLKAANKSREDKEAIEKGSRRGQRKAKEIESWTPTGKKSNVDQAFKLLFVLGPSRSGKSSIEAALTRYRGVLPCYESRRASSRKYLKNLATKKLQVDGSAVVQGDIEELLYYSEKEILADGMRILTCTNPFMIDSVHHIYDVFDNSYFLFVQRDTYETASEIFAKEYRSSRNAYSYNAASAADYVRWYNELTTGFAKKIPQRASCIKYEDFLDDQNFLVTAVENLLGEKLELAQSPLDFSSRSRSGTYTELYKEYLNEQCSLLD